MNTKKSFSTFNITFVIVMLLVMVVPMLDLGNIFRGPALSYNSMDYEVTIAQNGDVRIKQVVDVKMRKRKDSDGNVKPWRQLFGQYELSADQATSMKDISVKNLTTGETYTQGPINQNAPDTYPSTWDSTYAKRWYIADVTHTTMGPPAYNSQKDAYQPSAAKDKRKVELGWNIPATVSSDSMKFELAYTYTDVFTAYKDVSKAQISLLDVSNETPIGHITAQLRLPDGSDTKNAWTWFHFEGTSDSWFNEDGTRTFTATDVRGGNYFDIVTMLDNPLMKGVRRHEDTAVKAATISTETRMMDEWRTKETREARLRVLVWVLVIVIGLALSFFGIRAVLRDRKNCTYQGSLDYWREPPALSPAAAARLMGFLERDFGARGEKRVRADVVSSTMLSLMSKGAVGVFPGRASRYEGVDLTRADSATVARMVDSTAPLTHADKSVSTIAVLPVAYGNVEHLRLCPSEFACLNMLKYMAEEFGSTVFDTKEMHRKLKDRTSPARYFNAIDRAADKEFDALHVVKSASPVARTCGWGLMALGVAFCVYNIVQDPNSFFALLLCLGLPLFLIGLAVKKMAPAQVLVDPNSQTVGQVEGLKHYLEDFSDFTDRDSLDIALWNRFMVYATAFGVSAVVLRQLEEAYPEVDNPQWLDSNAANASVMYWALRPQAYRRWDQASRSGFAADGFGRTASAFAGDLGSQLSNSFSSIHSTLASAQRASALSAFASSGSSSSSSGGSHGGGFGGGGGGAGGGSYGGR